MPETGAGLTESFITCRRITDFLRSEDVDYLKPTHRPQNSSDSCGFSDATVGWRPASQLESAPAEGSDVVGSFQLRDLSISFPKGGLTLITGRFGSGKTLLLLALLGEASVISGNVAYARSSPLDASVATGDDGVWHLAPGAVAYAPQASRITGLPATLLTTTDNVAPEQEHP